MQSFDLQSATKRNEEEMIIYEIISSNKHAKIQRKSVKQEN